MITLHAVVPAAVAPKHGLRAICSTSDPTNRRGMLSGRVYKKAAAMQRISDRSQPNKHQILG